jgi:hypothetical protein
LSFTVEAHKSTPAVGWILAAKKEATLDAPVDQKGRGRLLEPQCVGDVADGDGRVLCVAAHGQEQEVLLRREPTPTRVLIGTAEKLVEGAAKIRVLLVILLLEATCSSHRLLTRYYSVLFTP